jgi:hypothetical protein
MARRSEYTADRVAMQSGLGPLLVDALKPRRYGAARLSRTQRAISRHPSMEGRAHALQCSAAGVGS